MQEIEDGVIPRTRERVAEFAVLQVIFYSRLTRNTTRMFRAYKNIYTHSLRV